MTLFLLLSNAITLATLVVICWYYRVPGKFYRRLVVESRVPGVNESFESNRFYATSRQLFDLYAASNPSDTRPATLVLGDSQVSLVNWNEMLPGFDAVGRGIPGDTVAGLSYRIGDYQDHQPATCVLMIGTNDVLTDRPFIETEAAYRDLVQHSLDMWPNSRIVLVSVPPFSKWVTKAEAKNNRVKQMNVFLSNLAGQSPRTIYTNLHDAIIDADQYLANEMTMDGVHLNAASYSVLRNQLQAIGAN
ncbi:GDSL-type esterase/lipase family protein [Rhodopirellula bahusiensis]|uniref:GDSL-type esterase/lipase family protein n=1 Tax=Rhodopirellula bahusiensis TaxID=2014065 RepID=UPI001179F391|nr:GDSL-type esterase/lipase family protein [Rhodopirellula bahusiensis]